jgi:hypothetical protein
MQKNVVSNVLAPKCGYLHLLVQSVVNRPAAIFAKLKNPERKVEENKH